MSELDNWHFKMSYKGSLTYERQNMIVNISGMGIYRDEFGPTLTDDDIKYFKNCEDVHVSIKEKT